MDEEWEGGRVEEEEDGRMEALGIGVLSYRRERLWSGIRGLSEPRITQDFADYADKSVWRG